MYEISEGFETQNTFSVVKVDVTCAQVFNNENKYFPAFSKAYPAYRNFDGIDFKPER